MPALSECAPIVFGSQAPDSGNSEILAHYGTPELKRRYLEPLLDNRIISCFSMTEPQGGSDHVSFNSAGVPGFYGIQEVEQYFQTHHTQADTFDQAKAPGMIQGAQVLAVWGYNVAQLADLLPRKPAPVEAAH